MFEINFQQLYYIIKFNNGAHCTPQAHPIAIHRDAIMATTPHCFALTCLGVHIIKRLVKYPKRSVDMLDPIQ